MKSVKKDHYFTVVVVGAALGGVVAALKLSKNKNFSVTLVAETDEFNPRTGATVRQGKPLPLLLSTIFSGRNVRLIRDTVVGLDTSRKLIVGTVGQYHYDAVIFSLGVKTNYFGIEGLQEVTWNVNSRGDEERLRKHLHDASVTKHTNKHYFIVGGGAAGVELAGSLKSYVESIGKRHNVGKHGMSVTLVEAAPRLLPHMHEQTSRRALARLRELGVDVMLKTSVKKHNDTHVLIGGNEVSMRNVIWTSGVTNHPFFAKHTDVFHTNERGFVVVNEHLEAAPGVFVIGENAVTPYAEHLRSASHDGKYVAKLLRQRTTSLYPTLYMPKRGSTIIPIGPKWALIEYGNIRMSGRGANLLGTVAHFMTRNFVLPPRDVLRTGRATPIESELECELCQKNNDSSSVAPSS